MKINNYTYILKQFNKQLESIIKSKEILEKSVEPFRRALEETLAKQAIFMESLPILPAKSIPIFTKVTTEQHCGGCNCFSQFSYFRPGNYI